jgi:hypothetical protein
MAVTFSKWRMAVGMMLPSSAVRGRGDYTHTFSLSLSAPLSHSLTHSFTYACQAKGLPLGFHDPNQNDMRRRTLHTHTHSHTHTHTHTVAGIFTKGLPLLGFYHPENNDMRRRVEFDFEAPQLDEEEDTCNATPPGLAGEQFWEFAPRRSLPDNMTLCA